MILHVINKSSIVEQCLAHAANGDAIIFIENAANMKTVGTAINCIKPPIEIKLYILTDKVSEKNLIENNIETISNDKFVSLSCEAEKVVSWY